MGIYVFNRKVLEECLDNDFVDFGKNVIPAAINKYKVHAYIFQGYWEDIGTIRAFFDANLQLTTPNPKFSFNVPGAAVYTHPRFLPASVVRSAQIDHTMISDGCIIDQSVIENCIIGVRSIIQPGSTLKNVILMGLDNYEADLAEAKTGVPLMGIGRDCHIENAIIDKNARIGDNVVISPKGKAPDTDGQGYYVRDGIVVIPKNSVIPPGTWI
jgi:glucose-1-phosphate adenylyltransferase